MISLIFSGYLSSIGKVLKNIRRYIAFFRGPNIDRKKNMKKDIFQFENENEKQYVLLTAMLNVFVFIILSVQ